MSEFYFFDNPPSENDIEYAGTQIGISNIITRTKSIATEYDKAIDNKPGVYEGLIKSVTRCMRGRDLFIHDVVIHGIKVRAHTNSKHLADFWKINWFSAEEWIKKTGQKVSEYPQITVYAFIGVPEQKEAAYYSRNKNSIIVFNTSYYGQLKYWVLGAVGWFLTNKYGIHSIRGSTVEKDGEGVLYIAPTGTDKSTLTYGLIDYPNTRFHSDDWVYVRYCHKLKNSKYLHIYEIDSSSKIQGYKVHKWIEQNRYSSFNCKCLTDDGEEVELSSKEFDFDSPIKAFAYITEKVVYLKSNIIEQFPEYTPSFLKSRLENIPKTTAEFIQKEGLKLINLARLVKNNSGLENIPEQRIKELMSRLYSFENARAMLDLNLMFDSTKTYSNPLEPLHLNCVILLGKDSDDNSTVKNLTLGGFCSQLIYGLNNLGERAVAYNPYRVADELNESEFINALDEELKKSNGKKDIYDIYCRRLDNLSQIPDTFYTELELYRVLYGTAACYCFNTTFQRKNFSSYDDASHPIKIITDLLVNLPHA